MKTNAKIVPVMARKARSKKEREADALLGKRLARLRKERGYTQLELAEKMSLVQALISDYECGKLRPHPEMLVRFAKIFQVSADEILGIKPIQIQSSSIKNRRFMRRLRAINNLPKRDQDALVRTIDAFLAARKAG